MIIFAFDKNSCFPFGKIIFSHGRFSLIFHFSPPFLLLWPDRSLNSQLLFFFMNIRHICIAFFTLVEISLALPKLASKHQIIMKSQLVFLIYSTQGHCKVGKSSRGTIQLRHLDFLGEKESKFGQMCQRIVVKNLPMGGGSGQIF